MIEAIRQERGAKPARQNSRYPDMFARFIMYLGFASILLAQPLSPGERKKYDALCAMERSADEAEPAAAKAYSSVRLRVAQFSWSWFWAFLNNPATRYQDRIAAAYQGSHLVSARDLPVLWAALAAQSLRFSVQESPCNRIYSAALWTGPPGLPEYPTTAEDRSKAPWQWQVSRALQILNREVQKYYVDPGRYRQMIAEAWKWHPTDFWEAYYRWEAINLGPRNVDRLRSIVRLALSDQHIGRGAPPDLSLSSGDSYHTEELAHVAQIVILMNTKDANIAGPAAYWAGRLAHDTYPNDSTGLKPLSTTTGVLAVARWATDPKVDPFTRYYSFVGPITVMIDNPPLKFDPQMPPASPKVRTALDTFEHWYQTRRSRLERETAAEKPRIRRLADELAGADPGVWTFAP